MKYIWWIILGVVLIVCGVYWYIQLLGYTPKVPVKKEEKPYVLPPKLRERPTVDVPDDLPPGIKG